MNIHEIIEFNASAMIKKAQIGITTLTLRVANAINTSPFDHIRQFYNEATCNEYTTLTHHNFFYSYPEYGLQWGNDKSCEFHRVETKCHLCDWKPSRNYAGIGTIYILHNGVSDEQILISKGKAKMYVKNTDRLSRMILLCPQHIGSHFRWVGDKTVLLPNQLQLF